MQHRRILNPQRQWWGKIRQGNKTEECVLQGCRVWPPPCEWISPGDLWRSWIVTQRNRNSIQPEANYTTEHKPGNEQEPGGGLESVTNQGAGHGAEYHWLAFSGQTFHLSLPHTLLLWGPLFYRLVDSCDLYYQIAFWGAGIVHIYAFTRHGERGLRRPTITNSGYYSFKLSAI